MVTNNNINEVWLELDKTNQQAFFQVGIIYY
jgi:hypothetical protein